MSSHYCGELSAAQVGREVEPDPGGSPGKRPAGGGAQSAGQAATE